MQKYLFTALTLITLPNLVESRCLGCGGPAYQQATETFLAAQDPNAVPITYYATPNWYLIALTCAIFFVTTYVLGLQVQKRNWQVGYTRKIGALIGFFAPGLIIALIYATQSDLLPNLSRRIADFPMHSPGAEAASIQRQILASTIAFTLCLLLLSKPIRHRIGFFNTCFASIDRPEDRPYTLPWLISSIWVTTLIILGWLWIAPQQVPFLIIALWVAGVGDALAEPIGLKFGKHRYRVPSLDSSRTYTRSLEGSAMVWLCTVMAILALPWLAPEAHLNGPLWVWIAVLPAILTLTEAKSPHTWDQPFIVLSTAITASTLQTLFT